MATPRISVLGMGNVLMGDDGAGPYAVAMVDAQFAFPDSVAVLDVGTPGLDLIPYLSDADTLILVDTVYSDAPSGSIRSYSKEALLKCKLQPRLSPHDPALGQCLTTLEMEGRGPREVLLVGIVPERTAFGPGLSTAVQDAIPAVVARVVEEVAARGIAVEARTPARVPDLWWEVPV